MRKSGCGAKSLNNGGGISMEIKKVGVVGTGTMGSGIAWICAQYGYQTIMRARTDESAAKGMDKIRSSIARAVERGKITEQDRNNILDCLKAVTALEDLKDCDLVIEAIIEDSTEKKKLFAALDELCPGHTILVTATSSLSVIEIAAVTGRPDRVVGLHFGNPPTAMKCVEVARTIASSDGTVDMAKGFVESLEKKPILAKDTPGFVMNRFWIPFILEAIRVFEAGIASREDIDDCMVLGMGHTLGPLAAADLGGLDTIYMIANSLYDQLKDPKCAPPPLLRQMVLAGYLGRKTGKGFYDYKW